ncbi:exodeoxyribonuclease VII large subunit [Aquibacillus sediminis]|uniref:exodeoxyribonuclease VII large subunit n=1 Tax=Aquibacillus sediminis TaxID=2574734 RepID=UPI0011089BCF|nr:exodeoxyribonuclease VII large subunit [Aquibacillus sediminis]
MNDKYLTVSALTRYLKRKIELDKHLRQVWLKGEVSNFKHHSRGHMYLTIKDDYTRIQAVMFAGNNRHLKFKPENGMNVLIKGEVNIYEPQGQYQLYIQQMEPDGIGALYLAFEQLKQKLANEGLFDELHKQALPSYPKHIGVITSPTGAAIRDIVTTIRRRYPIVKLTVIPVLVQGEQSPQSIEKGIKQANEMDDFDVLIVGRGGGSIEELWSFNEERVARAIAASHIPIISAVGHETDVTISDLIADKRAPTPTGAAELAVPSQIELQDKLKSYRQRLDRIIKEKTNNAKERLDQFKKSYAFRYPTILVQQKEQELDKNVDRMAKSFSNIQQRLNQHWEHVHKRLNQQHPDRQLTQYKQQLDQLRSRQTRVLQQVLQTKENQLEKTIDKLMILNPLHTMKRGYSISYTKNGEVVQSAHDVQPGQQIAVKLHDGTLDCQVWGIEEDKSNE